MYSNYLRVQKEDLIPFELVLSMRFVEVLQFELEVLDTGCATTVSMKRSVQQSLYIPRGSRTTNRMTLS